VRTPIVVAVLFASLSTACATSTTTVRASGAIGARAMETDVDSEIARRYLARPSGDPTIDDVRARYDAMPLDRESLRALSHETSPDFATIYFCERVLSDPRNRALQTAVDDETEALKSSGGRARGAPPTDVLVLVVPGYLYQTNPTSGASLESEIDALKSAGYAVERVLTLDDGTVEENSLRVAERLRAARKEQKRVVLVSGSKGGPETAHALGVVLAPDETEHVIAWVSAGGLMRGTPAADDFTTGPKGVAIRAIMWARFLDPEGLASLTTQASTARLARGRIPAHVFIVQYVAVPLSGQVSDDARDRYELLRRDGPNDGMGLLADELIGGATVLELGSDHYFKSNDDQPLRTLAVATVVLAHAHEHTP
jgi:hypothetical protein